MNSRWLEDFISLAKTGNITRSASLRHSNQSAFSRRIQALENWLGGELFDRDTKPMQLTLAGQAFHPAALKIMQQIEQAKRTVQTKSAKQEATIRFAAPHSVASQFFPGWLRSLEVNNSKLTANIISFGAKTCFELLGQGKVDFVLCHSLKKSTNGELEKDFTSVALESDQLIPVSASDAEKEPLFGPLATASSKANYLAYCPESTIGEIVSNALEMDDHGFKLNTVFTSEYASIIKTMTLEHFGFAWLPMRDIATELANGDLVVAGPPEWKIYTDIRLFCAKSSLTSEALRFWDEVAALP